MSEISILKKINRNAFSEKLIHRYLFERYYFGNSEQRKKLLPERLHKYQYQINLIVPEGSKREEKYRADLEIFFKNHTKGVPIEVKWHLNDFKKDNQKNYIKQENGFVVVLGETDLKIFDGIDVVRIDHDDFAEWIADNISRLSRESLIYQAKSKNISNKSQYYWVIFLKGGANGPAIKNFDRMLASKSNNTFWAFRQHPRALSNILDIQKGDKIIFIFATGGKSMAQPKDPKTEIKVYRYYICNIIEPYYMALDNERGLFFENQEIRPEINNRHWPHFIDFEIKKRSKKDIELHFGEQGIFAKAFSDSFNYGRGTPYPLSRAEFEKLKDHLLKLSSKIR